MAEADTLPRGEAKRGELHARPRREAHDRIADLVDRLRLAGGLPADLPPHAIEKQREVDHDEEEEEADREERCYRGDARSAGCNRRADGEQLDSSLS